MIRCHHCLVEFDLTTADPLNPGAPDLPDEGSALICGACGGVTIYTSTGGRRPTLDEEHEAILWLRDHGL